MSQVLFLFDLDQCLPLTNIGLTSEKLEFLMARLRRACLRILLSHSSGNIISSTNITASGDILTTDLKTGCNLFQQPQHFANFSFRFYSSNE